jgi:hypothetical protein
MISKHWGMNDLTNGYANIYCQTMHDGVKHSKIKIGREILTELRQLERFLKDSGFKGWVSWTQLINPNIMKMLTKIKAYPYGINLKQEKIWFRKQF